MANPIAEEIQAAIKGAPGQGIPPGLAIKAMNELRKQQRKLEQAVVPWANFTDRNKRDQDGDND